MMSNTDLDTAINHYLPYLVEVRKRLFLVVSVAVIATVLGFVYYRKIIGIIISVLDLQEVNIVFTSPFQYLELSVSAALLIGAVTAFPVIIMQLLSFLKPALQKREYRLLMLMTPVSIVLFAGGFIFGVFIMKFTIAYFQQESARLNIGSVLDITALLSNIINVSVLMGLAFQFPIILTALMQLHVINQKWLSKKRKYVYSAALLFVIFLPITNVLTDLILTLPLVILYELTVLLNAMLLKRK